MQKIAEELDFNSIADSSWTNNIAAINSFLKFVFEKEEDYRDFLSVKHGVSLSEDFKTILPELNSITFLSQLEIIALKQNSYIANLYRKTGLRSSEALQLTWNMIDIENQKVYFISPKGGDLFKNKGR